MNKSQKTLLIIFVITLFVSTGIVILGALFKIQHWPGASMLLVIGSLGEIVALIIAAVLIVKVVSAKKNTDII